MPAWAAVSVRYATPAKRLCGNRWLAAVSAQSISGCASLCGNVDSTAGDTLTTPPSRS